MFFCWFSRFSLFVALPSFPYQRIVHFLDLPEAVAASCAIPSIFKPVMAGEEGKNRKSYADGGVTDRTGLDAYSVWKKGLSNIDGNDDDDVQNRKCLIHLVDSSSRYEASNIYQGSNSRLFIRTPRANANFFSLKDYEMQRMVAYRAAMLAMHDKNSDVFMDRSGEVGYVVDNNDVYIRKKGRLMQL